MNPDETHNKPTNGLAQGTPDLSPGVDRLLPLPAEPQKSKSSSHGSLPKAVVAVEGLKANKTNPASLGGL